MNKKPSSIKDKKRIEKERSLTVRFFMSNKILRKDRRNWFVKKTRSSKIVQNLNKDKVVKTKS